MRARLVEDEQVDVCDGVETLAPLHHGLPRDVAFTIRADTGASFVAQALAAVRELVSEPRGLKISVPGTATDATSNTAIRGPVPVSEHRFLSVRRTKAAGELKANRASRGDMAPARELATLVTQPIAPMRT